MKQIQLTYYMDEIEEIKNMSLEEKKAYIAGVVDGEGSIYISYYKIRDRYEIEIKILDSTDYGYVTEIQKILRELGYYLNINIDRKTKNKKARMAYRLKFKNKLYIIKFINDFKEYLILKSDQLNVVEKIINNELQIEEGCKITKMLNEKGKYASNLNRKIKRNVLYLNNFDLLYNYIAGLIDGEGSISFYYKKMSANFSIVYSSNSSYITLINEMINKLGFYPHFSTNYNLNKSNTKPNHCLSLRKKNTILKFSSIIKKYLILKKPRLEYAVNIINKIDVEENVKKLKELNKKGVSQS